MILDFKLPDIGEGIAEGEIVKWLVEVGDEVQEHQPVLEVSTDKALVEIPAPASGRVARILVPAGETVPIHTVIYQIEIAAEAVRQQHSAVESTKAAAARAADNVIKDDVPAATRVRAVPSARRLARELDVDLHQVSGTGRFGLIRRTDVQSHAAARAEHSPDAGAAQVVERVSRTPFLGVRRKIAAQMMRSITNAAHFTVVEEVDVTELVRLMPHAKEIGNAAGARVTYTPFLMKALASTLLEHPSLNATLDEAAQEIVTYHYVHLGVATDTPLGLLVPVVREVERKGVIEISRDLASLTQRARDGQLKVQEMRDGTFTISNAGQIGSIHATPIINFPEVGILGAHRIVKRPGVVETAAGDRIEVRHYMNLSMSVDHRLADGMVAVKALVHIKKLLEQPGLLAL